MLRETGMSPLKKNKSSREILDSVLDLCADCDTCRTLMDEDCAFFPELYRLWDQEKEDGRPISDDQVRQLVELCTLCGLCPCPRIPIEVMEAKARYIEEEGLPLSTRMLTDVPRMARLCGTFPKLVNMLQNNEVLGAYFRKVLRLHPERELPKFAAESFFQWAETKGLTQTRAGESAVVYFAGCTAGYLFPEIGQSLVTILEKNGIQIHVPGQKCCGMPHLVEGDRNKTLACAQDNLELLLEAAEAESDILCSCPTCGFFFKELLKERAVYSEAYQDSVNSGADELKVPESLRGDRNHKVLKKSMYKEILKDDGYFSSIDPMERIEMASQTFDAGEYLLQLHRKGKLNTDFGTRTENMVYFAPCHQREQRVGRPYLDLMKLIPQLSIELVGDSECCGMGGNFGYKAQFHATSLELGQPLLEKIKSRNPQAIVTDCMSCRLQFNHALSIPVFHPLQVLARGYEG
jgi:glycerol-3-phosphate dehydrogenase subunit C